MNANSISDFVKNNKSDLINKGIIVAGGLAGIAIGLAFHNKASAVIEEASISDETTDDSVTTEDLDTND